ncbi:MAG: PAS domain-containing sensor histidine kinase [Acidimicrobiia bacterium]|nr:PAS domain-containing sensor histidine kinase [Acidimicrobiia bacterium]
MTDPPDLSGRSPLQREFIHDLVQGVTDYAIFVLDPDGHVMTWNAGAERLKGYRAEDIIGRHFSCFYLPEDVEAELPDQELAIAMSDGHFEDEGWRLRSDGSTFWANVVITVIRGADGRLTGFGKVTRDLSERRRGEAALRDSEERFRLLVTGVSDYAIFLLRADGTIDTWNLGAERLKGYPAAEIVGQHFSVFYTEEDRRQGVPDQGLREALEHGRWESEGWRVRRDGSRFWANVIITALRNAHGEHCGFAKVTRDLTDRKRGEDALRGVLEREREASARLAELDGMKTELVAVIAHDLRGPVNVVQHLLQMMLTDWAGITDDKKLELLERAAKRAVAVSEFVDDAFDVVQIEAGELRVVSTPFDIADAVHAVTDDAAVTNPDRRLVIDVGAGTKVVGDERRTWQVLANLVSNAIKFSPPDSPIELDVRRDGAEVTVTVTDHGPGIPELQQPLLFRRFVRLPQSAHVPGSGIGLFIARSLVEAQAGRMWLRSADGEGATFGFALPAATSAA